MRTVVLLLLVGASAASATPVVDDRMNEAKAHFKAGRAAYNLKEWDKAVTEYKLSYERNPLPTVLYDIAQAYRLKGDSENALDFYMRFLDEAPHVADDRQHAEDDIHHLTPLVEAAR